MSFMLCITTAYRMVRYRFLLLLGIALALFFLTSHNFIRKRAVLLDEYTNNLISGNWNGKWKTIKSSKTMKLGQQRGLGSKSSKINITSRRARLHLIIQFPVLNTSGSQTNVNLTRQQEFIHCLQRNLLSPHVQKIHILCETDRDPLFIRNLDLRMNWKLLFHILGWRMRYKDAFQYASQNLLGKNAMIINADCYVDKGFEYLNEDILSRKTVYALTRHERLENVHFCKKRDFCGPNSKYIGSHDAWMFRLLAPVPAAFLSNIDFRPNIEGIERVLIFNLRKYGRFRIKNPCKLLHIVHYHCSRIKNTKERLFHGQRIDHYFNITTLKQGKVVNAPFSDL
ncbi:uncharacterized protein [Montipora capricornis]|uniref:uncharacterized protein n=1 Tax=Montipora capricornis TaxID=246305 RepID=UPI0035F1AFD4